MSTSAEVEAAWSAAVWLHADIAAITGNVFPYEFTRESELELAALQYEGAVNFFTYKTSRTEEYIGTNVVQEKFTVQVDYYREKDTKGEAWTATRDALETLDGLVVSELGYTWTDTVGFWVRQKDAPVIDEVEIEGARCWHSRFYYYANT